MKRVAVSQLKDRLSEYLRLVKRGETIEIVERSVPIARIEAIHPAAQSTSEKVARLVREGVISAPSARLEKSFFSRAPIPCTGDIVRTVLEERDER
jgi:antitoxin (DNA-binding transcriptional repressor) of toxin-antitoxin stability system